MIKAISPLIGFLFVVMLLGCNPTVDSKPPTAQSTDPSAPAKVSGRGYRLSEKEISILTNLLRSNRYIFAVPRDSVSVSAVAAEFQENSLAADGKYKHPVFLEGVVLSVSRDAEGFPIANVVGDLSGGGADLRFFKSDSARMATIKPRQRLSARCSVASLPGGKVMFDRCQFDDDVALAEIEKILRGEVVIDSDKYLAPALMAIAYARVNPHDAECANFDAPDICTEAIDKILLSGANNGILDAVKSELISAGVIQLSTWQASKP